MSLLLLGAMTIAGSFALVQPVLAFPPYKSTDADTAEPQTVEARVGTQFESRHGIEDVLAPRVRLNFGLPNKVEIASEFDYSSSRGSPDDGAIGVKWIPITSERINIGVEALGLLPVNSNLRGLGTETQLVATIKAKQFLLHLNAGGFYDPRERAVTSGWRASGLLEIPIESMRVGLELYARRPTDNPVDARAGIGMIVPLGAFDIRAGAHAGLSKGAPTLTVNLWITRIFSLFQ